VWAWVLEVEVGEKARPLPDHAVAVQHDDLPLGEDGVLAGEMLGAHQLLLRPASDSTIALQPLRDRSKYSGCERGVSHNLTSQDPLS
jgi:hypothetical protein